MATKGAVIFPEENRTWPPAKVLPFAWVVSSDIMEITVEGARRPRATAITPNPDGLGSANCGEGGRHGSPQPHQRTNHESLTKEKTSFTANLEK